MVASVTMCKDDIRNPNRKNNIIRWFGLSYTSIAADFKKFRVKSKTDIVGQSLDVVTGEEAFNILIHHNAVSVKNIN